MSGRTREFFGLVPVSLLVTAGFTAVLIARSDEIQTVTVTYGAVFLVACLLGHLFIRWRLPYADPYLFPLAALLAAFGLVIIYRINEDLARQQAQWFIFGLALFSLTIVFLRDLRALQRYRYTIAIAGIVLLAMPRILGETQNGAFLAIDLGPISFQPAEFAKLAIIIFLASYLADNREVLLGGRTAAPPLSRTAAIGGAAALVALFLILVLGAPAWPSVLGCVLLAAIAAIVAERPSLKHIGPLLLVWGMAMLMLFVIRDLGSSLMFFGGFLVVLYVATSRLSFVVAGISLFAAGATFFATSVTHVQNRVSAWLDPFDQKLIDMPGGSGQLVQSFFAQSDGGLFGRGLGKSLLYPPGIEQNCTPAPGCASPLVPLPDTDSIYALIANELGLFGAVAVLLVCLLFTARGFRIAVIARDEFTKLLAVGLSAVFALQVFVIVGGVTGAIPLTGVTLPFVSRGGSSLMANFILVALLLILSDGARRAAEEKGQW
ncbi:MAG: FtsW/RodA/SpoVE family cell cycle protein [Thermoleophilaceae bacterium]|nr:FtsW/RodA/SpoVE family cell cycle protein [Thermoleophilaceae bacterium]